MQGQKIAVIVVLVLAWVGWIIWLGGLAGFSAKCDMSPSVEYIDVKPTQGNPNPAPKKVSIPSGFANLGSCSSADALSWWALWWSCLIYIMVCVYQFAPAGRLAGLRRVSLVFLAMASGVMMLTADSASNTIDLLKAPNPVSSLITISKCDSKKPPEECSYYEGEQGSVDDAKTCMQVVMGGTVMCIILNFLLIIDACMEDAQPPEAPAPAAKPATPAMPVEYPLPASFAATPVKAPAAGPTVVEIPPAPMTPVAAVGMATPQQPPVGMA